MKIKRTINGTDYTFELLPNELYDAYREQQEKFDIDDVINFIECFSNEELQEYYGCSYEECMKYKEEIADEMRRNMDKYDMDFEYAREEAIRDIVRKEIGVTA